MAIDTGGILTQSADETPRDFISQQERMASSILTVIDASKDKHVFGGETVAGAKWDGESELIRLSQRLFVTADSGGNVYAAYAQAFPNGVLQLSIENIDANYAADIRVVPYRGAALQTLSSTAAQLVVGTSAAPGRTAVVQIQAVGW